ncbi:MAG: hypothetical protein KBT06_02860 [Prevotellaceae bacterium]|nr:hypothetical protein [Candidatus Colivivens equi]
MKKKAIISILFLIGFVFSVFGQAPQLKKGGHTKTNIQSNTKKVNDKVSLVVLPQETKQAISLRKLDRKVLFTFGENEILYDGENLTNLNFTSSKYCFILQNTLTKKKTLVWNGSRVINGNNIWVTYLDLYDFEKCIVLYNNDSIYNYEYLHIDGKNFGPYENVDYFLDWELASYYSYDEVSGNAHEKCLGWGWLFKNCFVYTIMGTDFFYNNGKIEQIDKKYQSKNSWNNKIYTDTRKIAKMLSQKGISPNGKHYASISANGIINIDNVICHQLCDSIKSDYGIITSNEGDVYVWLSSDIHYFIPNNGLPRLMNMETEKFDGKSFKIVSAPQKPCGAFAYKSDWRPEYYAITLYDKSSQNMFMSKLTYPYIIINNNKYGVGAALSAEYNAAENSFVWTAIESNEYVMYRFHL